jgi:starvation-inducible DNA-binding protein
MLMNDMTALITHEVQRFGTLAPAALALGENIRAKSVAALNRLLAHTMALRDLYKKAHWQTSGPTFLQLHELFDRHHGEQLTLMDALAERVQMLGGVALALAGDLVSESRLARDVPRGRETPEAQLRRLVASHEVILTEARPLAREAAEHGDDGTNDLIVSQVIRTNEMQSWFLAEHLARFDGR